MPGGLPFRPLFGTFRRMVWTSSLVSQRVGADESAMDFIPASYSTALFHTRSSMGEGEDGHLLRILIGPLPGRATASEDALTP
jgi:hypothetical protein